MQSSYVVVLSAAMMAAMGMAQAPKASSGVENHALGAVTRAEGTPDQIFLMKAIESDNGVIDAAKLALARSKNDQVKQYAQLMVEDHMKMLSDLHDVERGQTLKYKDTPSATARALHARLITLKGAAFDKTYVNGMVKGHTADVKAFSEEAETGKDGAIKAAAEKALPMIKHHLEVVQGLQKTVG